MALVERPEKRGIQNASRLRELVLHEIYLRLGMGDQFIVRRRGGYSFICSQYLIICIVSLMFYV